jgi:L-iditol 2-dehydrogenase
MNTMKQIILAEPGKLELRDAPVPEPDQGEVVVRVSSALTCGTDLKAYVRGHNLIPMPGPFGHEYSGSIAGIGKGVEGFKEGDHVMGVHSAPCLECRYCKKGMYNLCDCIMSKKALGAFAEYLLLPATVVKHNLFHKPACLGFNEAALLEPLSCVVHPYRKFMNTPSVKKERIKDIETVLVIGAGPIGLIHLAYLKMHGIKVIACDISKERLATARKMGADRNAFPDEVVSALNEVTGNLGADLVIECTGQKGVWEKSVHYPRRGGTVVLFGGCPAGDVVTYDTHRLHYDEITLMGSFHYSPDDVKTAYDALTENKIDLSPLISGEFPLNDIDKAFSLLKESKGIKYVIRP